MRVVVDENGWKYQVIRVFKDGSMLLKPLVSRSVADEMVEDTVRSISRVLRATPRWIDYCYSVKVAKQVLVYADEAHGFHEL